MEEANASSDSSINAKRGEDIASVHYFQLLKYASRFEVFMFALGLILSAVVGLSTPVSFIFFADIVNDFTGFGQSSFAAMCQGMAILGVATSVVAYGQMFCLQYCARRQLKRIRSLYFS
ncbi:hypothetical protein ACTXT7_015840, partial [Hymenolepis weldensis]